MTRFPAHSLPTGRSPFFQQWPGGSDISACRIFCFGLWQLKVKASETIIVEIANLLSKNGLFFAVIAGVALSGILASTMSTADSQLLAASSSISSDILTGFFHIKVDEKKLLIIFRICLAVIGVLGGAWNIYELLPAFIVAIVVNVAVSLLTPAPEKAVTDVFDMVNR